MTEEFKYLVASDVEAFLTDVDINGFVDCDFELVVPLHELRKAVLSRYKQKSQFKNKFKDLISVVSIEVPFYLESDAPK